MQTLFTIFLIVHIIGGMLALITGLIAMLTHKGGKAHRLNGKIYFGGMTAVFLTSIYMSIAHNNPFLLMVGFFSYYMVVRGYRILYLKKLGQGLIVPRLDWIIAAIGMFAGAALVIYGVRAGLMLHQTYGFVAIPFGILSMSFAWSDIKLFTRGPKDKMHWWYGHIGSMGGGYIATFTAFCVVNVTFLPGLVVWLLPPFVGAMLITYTIAKYKRQFSKTAVATVKNV